jgi:hypothetical protein
MGMVAEGVHGKLSKRKASSGMQLGTQVANHSRGLPTLLSLGGL